MKNENTVSLKEHFYELRKADKEHASDLRKADKEAIALALNAAEKAVAVAERNAEKWRDNANEWRSAMVDRENKFMHQSEFNAYKESAQMALGVEKTRGDKKEGKGDGSHAMVGYIAIAISIIGGIIAITSKL